MQTPRITIDANCVINLFDIATTTATSVEELRTLIRYGLENKVEIAITTRLEADLLQDRDEERRRRLLQSLNMFPVIGSIGRWDVSGWDGDHWPDERTGPLNEEIQRIVAPGLERTDRRYTNKVNDIDHLTGHALAGRDIFVTDDRGILSRRDQLRHGPGILVMSPAQCVLHVDAVLERSKPRSLPTDGLNPKYHERRLTGRVSFDYSNNSHRYALGEAQYLFETRWSKASNSAIHVYTDGDSIEALALAKGASSIADVRDAEVFDYSSRVRTPRIGEVVVWRNVNGLYGATQIVSIKDDTRGDDGDEVVFDFHLLPDGGRDFSSV